MSEPTGPDRPTDAATRTAVRTAIACLRSYCGWRDEAERARYEGPIEEHAMGAYRRAAALAGTPNSQRDQPPGWYCECEHPIENHDLKTGECNTISIGGGPCFCDNPTWRKANALAGTAPAEPTDAMAEAFEKSVRGKMFTREATLEGLRAALAVAAPARIACGQGHPDARINADLEAMREDIGAPPDTAGCGQAGIWFVMYRCAECGRWFHRDCIRKHFAAHSSAGAPAAPAPDREAHWQEAVDWIVKHLRAVCELQPDENERKAVLAVAAAVEEGAIASLRKVHPELGAAPGRAPAPEPTSILTVSTPPDAPTMYVCVCTCGQPCPMHGLSAGAPPAAPNESRALLSEAALLLGALGDGIGLPQMDETLEIQVKAEHLACRIDNALGEWPPAARPAEPPPDMKCPACGSPDEIMTKCGKCNEEFYTKAQSAQSSRLYYERTGTTPKPKELRRRAATPPNEAYHVAADIAHEKLRFGSDMGLAVDAIVEAVWRLRAAPPPSEEKIFMKYAKLDDGTRPTDAV